MGEIPFDGILKVGHNVQIGYFAQNQAQLLDENLTVYQTIDNVARGDIRLRINDILGAFMFGGEASEKYVRYLSGGERSRLAMIRLLLEPVNLLILDEPTNHLDMVSKDVLKEAIKTFDGTVIVVSHDREFLDGLVDKVYEFADGNVREHLGGIYEYLQNKNAATIIDAIHRATADPAEKQKENNAESLTNSNVTESVAPNSNNNDWAARKAEQKRLNKIQKRKKELEESIEKLENQKKALEAELIKPENASNMQMVNEYTDILGQLEKLEEEYFS